MCFTAADRLGHRIHPIKSQGYFGEPETLLAKMEAAILRHIQSCGEQCIMVPTLLLLAGGKPPDPGSTVRCVVGCAAYRPLF